MMGVRRQKRASILDDVWGRISSIQLQIGRGTARLGSALAEIMRRFGADTQFIMAAPRDILSTSAAQGNVVFLEYDEILDPWAQDRQIALRRNGRHHLVPMPTLNAHFIDTVFVPRSMRDIHECFARVDPRLAAERNGLSAGLTREVAGYAGCTYSEYDLGVYTMDGGDVVADERCVFVGKSTFEYAMMAVFWRSAGKLDEVIDRMRIESLRDMVRDGIVADDTYRRLQYRLRGLRKKKGAQVLFDLLELIHGLGRYFSDYKINGVIRREAKTLKHKLEMYAGGRSVRFLAVEDELPQHVDMYLTPLGNGKLFLGDYRMIRDVVLQEYAGVRCGGMPMADCIDEENARYVRGMQTLREALSIDYDVIGLPYCAGIHCGNTVQASIMPNNSLIECYRNGNEAVKKAYVGLFEAPYSSSALTALNGMTKDAFERQGYSVVPVGGLGAVYEYNGSLRCLAKVLKRDL